MDKIGETDTSAKMTRLLQIEKERSYETIKQDMLKELAQEQKHRDGFEDRLYQHWGKALNLYETMLLLGRSVGNDFNQRVRPFAAKQNDFVFDVLARTHARSCLTTSAILTLLKSGHASDALARARTLHELRVIATFINKGGNTLAEAYLLFEVIESLKAMRDYEKHSVRLGLEPLEPNAIAKLEQAEQKYHKKFMPQVPEKVMRKPYGWAAVALNGRNPDFRTIEEEVGLEHWRPHYGMANHPVHAGTKGIKFDIGFPGTRNLLPAGPSNAGLADPADIALISFNAITTLLLLHMRYLDTKDLFGVYVKSLVATQVMEELLKEAQQTFLEAHQELMQYYP